MVCRPSSGALRNAANSTALGARFASQLAANVYMRRVFLERGQRMIDRRTDSERFVQRDSGFCYRPEKLSLHAKALLFG